MARSESRGGGYDRAIDKKNIGMLASAQRAGENPSAPSSIGQLMTPSMGRSAPVDSGNTGNVNELAKRNESFLTDPTNINMLKQFGMSLAGGGSFGHAMYQAMTVPERAQAANLKAQEAGLDITSKQLDIQKKTGDLASAAEDKAKREEVFGQLKTMSDDELMNAANEMAASGDNEGARIALSMRKAANPDATGLIAQYDLAVLQGYKGTLMDFKKSSDTTTVLEGIRQKIATGQPLLPGEQQIYNDAVISDPIIRQMMAKDPEFLNKMLAGTGAPGGSATTPGTAAATPAAMPSEADIAATLAANPGLTREGLLTQLGVKP